ncbi:uncharacterized protein KY384_004564 [Bacidia gigantensis]|uniref:uncharacterized protein n=1 Tax=Bacidia gigantensis TaxID=2732470 RepID=UPI001D058BD8|nr:uncharacterized protein KY384_004564 [Bacidia gigantensis]KAG8531206.1 hypothetical protein KY384_004564 [Bacidia gigantensis]
MATAKAGPRSSNPVLLWLKSVDNEADTEKDTEEDVVEGGVNLPELMPETYNTENRSKWTGEPMKLMLRDGSLRVLHLPEEQPTGSTQREGSPKATPEKEEVYLTPQKRNDSIHPTEPVNKEKSISEEPPVRRSTDCDVKTGAKTEPGTEKKKRRRRRRRHGKGSIGDLEKQDESGLEKKERPLGEMWR